MAGLTPQGFKAKTLQEVLSDMGVELQTSSAFGPGVNLAGDGPIGQILGANAIQIALVWSALQGIYDARRPDAAEGTQLDDLSVIVGTTRLEASSSEVRLTITGTQTTLIPALSQVRIPDGEIFAIQDDVLIPFGGTISDVLAVALNTGPIAGAPGSVSEIVTLVAGWDTVTNPDDVTPGRSRETDAELRVRRETSLQIVGAGPDQAIRARLLEVAQVQAATVISNRTLVTDAFGIPGKSFRAVIYPSSPAPEDVAEAIYSTQPAGIYSDGAVLVEITDAQGFPQEIRYSIATELDLYLEAVLTKSSAYPADGDALVTSALFATYSVLSIGDDVILLDGICAAKAQVPGILTFELRAKFGSAPGPGDVFNLVVDPTEISIASVSPGRIVVT